MLQTQIATVPMAMVLDTNVVLNWLFFQEPTTLVLIKSLLKTHHWVSTPWMYAEAWRVAHSSHLAKYATYSSDDALKQGFATHATLFDDATVPPPHPQLRCKDLDDQIFLDLVRHTGAALLLTLDRDLLKLKKRATQFNPCFMILQPAVAAKLFLA